MVEHFGYDAAVEGRSPRRERAKTVPTDSCGEARIEVPRKRDGTFDQQLVRERRRRLSWGGEVVQTEAAVRQQSLLGPKE